MDELARRMTVLGQDPRIAAILDDVCRLTDMGFAAVARVTDTRWIACQVRDKIEFGLKPGEELELKTTICDEIRQSGNAVIIDHVGAEAGWHTHPTPALYGFESYISLPITLADGSFFGTLCAIDPSPRLLKAPELVAAMRDFAKTIGLILSRESVGQLD